VNAAKRTKYVSDALFVVAVGLGIAAVATSTSALYLAAGVLFALSFVGTVVKRRQDRAAKAAKVAKTAKAAGQT
jgi:hypothetical protein